MTTPNDSSTSKPRASSSTGSTIASASIRPRTKRFITGLEDFAETNDSASSTTTNNNSSALASPTASYFESPFQSRAASPIPSKHPSRSSSLRPSTSRSAYAGNGSTLSPGGDLASSLSGIWGKSWTSLQGLASNVLGNDLTDPIKDNPNAPRKPRTLANAQRYPNVNKWGPPEQTQPGAGSKEERKALVRAKQRQDMLQQGGRSDSYFSNPAVHFKRRTSDDFESSSAPPGNHDNRDALVYIHLVEPQDTLPGISIKFNCAMAAIKKSNGMWSNDGIQARKTLIIPVDACNIKGKRVVAPEHKSGETSSASSSTDNCATPTQDSVDWSNDVRRSSTATIRPSAVSMNSEEVVKTPLDEKPWTHESWILIDGHSTAIEIARLPRRNLGFFPRARRKSNAQSELDTKPSSMEQSRSSLTISDTSSTGKLSNHRSRRSSGSQDFARQMMGPGGVGTLKGKGPSAPGPAEDKLNKVFGNPLGLPSAMGQRRPSLDEASQSFELSSASVNLENFGSAVQGWVNKLARGASKAMDSTPSQSYNHSRQPRNGRTRRPVDAHNIKPTSSGDLIELANAFEIGEDEDEYADRGRMRTPTNGRLMPVQEGLNIGSSSQQPKIDRSVSERREY